MKVKDITDILEQYAPLNLQANFDNSGLLVGTPDCEVNGVLLAVDLTEEVLAEAEEMGLGMIVTHHPIVFSPLKRFNSRSYTERCVERAIRSNLVIYAAHTNLDSVEGGLSWCLAKELELRDPKVLSFTNRECNAGFGIVGVLKEAISFDSFMEIVASKFGLSMVRHSEVVKQMVERVAISSGSGGSLMDDAFESGCDVYMAADLRYNNFLDAHGRVTIVDIGHFESEYCAIDLFFDILSKKMCNFAIYKSMRGVNPVKYKVFK